MTKDLARTIGKKEALKFVTVGLIIAWLIMTVLGGLNWFFVDDYQINLIIAVIVIYACGYFYGQLAGIAILIKKRGYLWIGFFYGLLTLFTSAFISGWTGYFTQGVKEMGLYNNYDPFTDYIIKPVFWVTLFGLIPVLVVGFWFGATIKSKGEKFEKSIQKQA